MSDLISELRLYSQILQVVTINILLGYGQEYSQGLMSVFPFSGRYRK